MAAVIGPAVEEAEARVRREEVEPLAGLLERLANTGEIFRHHVPPGDAYRFQLHDARAALAAIRAHGKEPRE